MRTYSKRDSKKSIYTELTPEIISLKDIDILTNKYFLGFYINREIPKDTQKILKEKYPNKIIFDGRKIKKVNELK